MQVKHAFVSVTKLVKRKVFKQKDSNDTRTGVVSRQGSDNERDIMEIVSKDCPLDTFSNLQVLCTSSMADCKLMTGHNKRYPHIPKVVVKIALVNCPENKKTIESEAWLMSQCQHPNIVRLYNCYTFQNSFWVEMEYCCRGKLTSLFELGLPFTEPHIASIVKEILQGLDYLHSKLIVHNDLKSDNLLLGEDFSIKISDFGLSKQLKSKDQTRRRSLGTPYWMAPEQIGKNANYGLPVDIWSLGIIILEMTNSGIPPHFSYSPEIALTRIMALPAPKLNPHFTPAFNDFVSLALTKDPYQRATAKQLLQHPFITRNASEHPSKFIPKLIANAKNKLA